MRKLLFMILCFVLLITPSVSASSGAMVVMIAAASSAANAAHQRDVEKAQNDCNTTFQKVQEEQKIPCSWNEYKIICEKEDVGKYYIKPNCIEHTYNIEKTLTPEEVKQQQHTENVVLTIFLVLFGLFILFIIIALAWDR